MDKIPAAGSSRRYFVDEAGDATLFDRKGRSIIGQPGCSRFFILGLLDVEDPTSLEGTLRTLRASLVADPYFHRVPSMGSAAGKTALRFHATDDLPEVRKQVFECLAQENIRFLAVVRDKRTVLEYVNKRNAMDRTYHYSPHELYDSLVRRLFRNLLHSHDEYEVMFARRGASDRSRALHSALEAARTRFAERFGVVRQAAISIQSGVPEASGSLQAVDYFLWGLQRLYEKGDDRYVTYLWLRFRLVHDIDDTRLAPYGTYYSKRKPLTSAALKEQPRI